MSFFEAVRFLTVIPIPRRRRAGTGEETGRKLARAMRFFPVVGALIGCATAGVLLLAGRVFPAPLSSVVTVVFLLALTGALHLDGLADTFDGLFGARDREGRLRIMRDSHIGAYGVAAVVCALLLKVGALAALGESALLRRLDPSVYPRWLLELAGERHWAQVAAAALMPVWGRWVMVLGAGVGPYARTGGGKGAAFVEGTGLTEAILLGLVPLGLTGLVLGLPGLAAGLACALTGALLLAWWRARAGGVTGDILGALGESVEIAFLLALLVALPAGRQSPPF